MLAHGKEHLTCRKCGKVGCIKGERRCRECRAEYDRGRDYGKERGGERRRAAAYLRSYVKRGRVEVGRCVKCGVRNRVMKPVWRDYSAPLDVVWACGAHEGEIRAAVAEQKEVEW